MSRLSAVCLAAALAGPAAAQQPPPTTPPVAAPAPAAAPATMMPINAAPNLVLGRVVDGQFEATVTRHVPVQTTATVTEKTADGRLVQRPVQFTTMQAVQVKERMALDKATVTGADGQPVAKDKLSDLLNDESVVVVTYGAPAAEKYRKAFKDGTVFIAFPAPAMPTPGVMPVPVAAPKTLPVPAPKKSEP